MPGRWWLCLLMMMLVVPTTRAAEPELTVAAAVSLKEPLTRAGEAWTAQTGRAVRFTFGSSGQLAAQVRNGAPIEVVILAAAKPLDDLARDGLIDPATRRTIAGNRLVLIVPPDSTVAADSYKALADGLIGGRVAVGAPETVPAGMYAMQALKSLGLEPSVRARLVFGTNVRQVLDYVVRGEVGGGIVYATDARQAGGQVRVIATAPEGSHEPIVYPAAVVRRGGDRGPAEAFVAFCGGAAVQAMLRDSGFAPAPPVAAVTTQPAGGR